MRFAIFIDTGKFHLRINKKHPFFYHLVLQGNRRICCFCYLSYNFNNLTKSCRLFILYIYRDNNKKIPLLMELCYIDTFVEKKFCPCSLKVAKIVSIIYYSTRICIFVVNLYFKPMNDYYLLYSFSITFQIAWIDLSDMGDFSVTVLFASANLLRQKRTEAATASTV